MGSPGRVRMIDNELIIAATFGLKLRDAQGTILAVLKWDGRRLWLFRFEGLGFIEFLVFLRFGKVIHSLLVNRVLVTIRSSGSV
jgi:hypothetical protein